MVIQPLPLRLMRARPAVAKSFVTFPTALSIFHAVILSDIVISHRKPAQNCCAFFCTSSACSRRIRSSRSWLEA
jgi:hypothetical protein